MILNSWKIFLFKVRPTTKRVPFKVKDINCDSIVEDLKSDENDYTEDLTEEDLDIVKEEENISKKIIDLGINKKSKKSKVELELEETLTAYKNVVDGIEESFNDPKLLSAIIDPSYKGTDCIFTAIKEKLKVINNTVIQKVNVKKGERLIFVGDLHGDAQQLLNIFRYAGWPGEIKNGKRIKYIFNGDFVDRGDHSVQCTLLILIGRISFPNHFFVNRGNHEFLDLNYSYGLMYETYYKCQNDFSNETTRLIYQSMNDLFCYLPWCSLIQATDDESPKEEKLEVQENIDGISNLKKIFCAHGGIPVGREKPRKGPSGKYAIDDKLLLKPDIVPDKKLTVKIEEIESWDPDEFRDDSCIFIKSNVLHYGFSDNGNSCYASDLVWADPIPWINGYSYGVASTSKKPKYAQGRGCSVVYGNDCTKNFCDVNNIDLVLRSHQCVDDGCRKNHWRTYTIHSVPHYSGLVDNSASIGIIDIDDDSYMHLQIINCHDDNKKWTKMKDIQKLVHEDIRSNWSTDPKRVEKSMAGTYKQYFKNLLQKENK